jgi:hypothetical protein
MGGNTGGGGQTVADSGVPLPMIDPAKKSTDLTEQEKGQLCDWQAQIFGGYGHVTPCNGGAGTEVNFPDQASCVATVFTPRCNMTVGEFETCQLARLPLEACVYPDEACRATRTC